MKITIEIDSDDYRSIARLAKIAESLKNYDVDEALQELRHETPKE